MNKITAWIAKEQGKHFCHCGCKGVIKIKKHHHQLAFGIPKFLPHHRKRFSKRCPTCKKEFFIPPSRIKQKHCSFKCRGWRKHIIKKACLVCNRKFLPKKKYTKFCSQTCSGKSRRIRVNQKCQWCGKNFDIQPSKIKFGQGKFCSNYCRGLSLIIKKCVVCGGKRLPSDGRTEALCQLHKNIKNSLRRIYYEKGMLNIRITLELIRLREKFYENKEVIKNATTKKQQRTIRRTRRN